jgi:hypothetical protein
MAKAGSRTLSPTWASAALVQSTKPARLVRHEKSASWVNMFCSVTNKNETL